MTPQKDYFWIVLEKQGNVKFLHLVLDRQTERQHTGKSTPPPPPPDLMMGHKNHN